MVYKSMILEFKGDSWVKKVKYDTEKQSMVVEFKNYAGKYECIGVPKKLYEDFEKAKSRGTFFNQNIKGNYKNPAFDDLF